MQEDPKTTRFMESLGTIMDIWDRNALLFSDEEFVDMCEAIQKLYRIDLHDQQSMFGRYEMKINDLTEYMEKIKPLNKLTKEMRDKALEDFGKKRMEHIFLKKYSVKNLKENGIEVNTSQIYGEALKKENEMRSKKYTALFKRLNEIRERMIELA
jgi:hypothetical protein